MVSIQRPAWFGRLFQITGAWGVWTVISKLYDEVLYPLAILKFGPIKGGAIMAFGSILICFLALITHERSGRDWLGVNVVESIKEGGVEYVRRLDSKAARSRLWAFIRILLYLPSRSFLAVLWALKQGDWVAFLALSIMKDPFVTTVFLRHGCGGKLQRKDWLVFTASAILSNLYWILRSTIVVEILKFVARNLN